MPFAFAHRFFSMRAACVTAACAFAAHSNPADAHGGGSKSDAQGRAPQRAAIGATARVKAAAPAGPLPATVMAAPARACRFRR